MKRFNLSSLVMILGIIGSQTCLASTVTGEPQESEILNISFESGLYTDTDGKMLVKPLPLGNLKGISEPILIDFPRDCYRSQNAYIMMHLDGITCAYGTAAPNNLYGLTNDRYLKALFGSPAAPMKDGLEKASRFYHGEDVKIQCPPSLQGPYNIGMTLTEGRGVIQIESSDLILDCFMHPLSEFIVISTDKKCPIQQIIFYIANNQLPMRLCGRIELGEVPKIHLETLNVSTIKILHAYKDYVLPGAVAIENKGEK